jgi:hypothetical protein
VTRSSASPPSLRSYAGRADLSARERNRRIFEGVFGATYSAYIRCERLARLIAWLVWGSDTRPFYASMAAIGQVADASIEFRDPEVPEAEQECPTPAPAT